MNKIKLFCFPYAGGSAVLYKRWKQYLDDAIDLRPVELAGRGARITEPFYQSIDDTIDDLWHLLRHELDAPYALLGHSMGAMIVYELARKIRYAGARMPLHLFFSGRAVPHIPMKENKKYHLLGPEDFQQKVLDMGGTPPEFFKHPELLEMFLPLLRSDFRLAATEFSTRPIDPFICDITVMLGKEEEMDADQADGWKKHTLGLCSLYYFNGGHFFINDEVPRIARLVAKTLRDKALTPQVSGVL